MAEREELSNLDLISRIKWSEEDLDTYHRLLKVHKQTEVDISEELDDPTIIGVERSVWERRQMWTNKAIGELSSCISFYKDHVQRSKQQLKERVPMIMQNTVTRKQSKTLIVGGVGAGKTHVEALMLKKSILWLRTNSLCGKISPWYLKNLCFKAGPFSVKLLTKDAYSKMMLRSGRDVPLKPQRDVISGFDERDRHFFLSLLETSTVDSLKNKILGRTIDASGLPQLLELLPRFIGGTSLGIVVIDLSQRLNKHPIYHFYGDEGKAMGKGIHSHLTYEQIVKTLLQMILSMSPDDKMADIVIVGTHRDAEHSWLESRDKKERKIQEIIQSFGLQHSIVYTDEAQSRVIFPVNAVQPTDEDHAVGRKLAELAMNENTAEEVSIPLKYHNLELTLAELAEPRVMTVSLEQVFSHTSHYFTDVEELKKGLLFLHKSSQIFYFPEIPDLIFKNPQLLLKVLTEVTMKHIKLITNSDQQEEASAAIWKDFKERGIITEQSLGYNSNAITPKRMLQIMEKLLIICKVGESEYVMPSLLTSLAPLTTSNPFLFLQQRLPMGSKTYLSRLIHGTSSDVTMLIHFSSGPIPFGVYCSTLCKLVSDFRWKLTGEVFRNKACFTLPQSPGVVTLIDSLDSFFVVNLEMASEFSASTVSPLCVEIRTAIFEAIKSANKILNYVNSNPVVGFLCSHDNECPHAAVYFKDNHCLQCVKDKTSKPLNEKHQLWLGCDDKETTNMSSISTSSTPRQSESMSATPSSGHLCPPQVPDSTGDGAATYQECLDQIPETHRFKLQLPIESDDHIHKLAGKLAGWEAKHYLFDLDYDPDVKDILNGQNKGNPTLQRIEVLRTWKRKTRDPSYGCLLHVLADGGFTDCSALVISLIKEN